MKRQQRPRVLAAVIALVTASLTAAAAPPETNLTAHMDRLAALQSRWHTASDHLAKGDMAAAIASLGEEPFDDVPEPLRMNHRFLAQRLPEKRLGWAERKDPPEVAEAIWHLDAEVAERAVEKFEAAFAKGASRGAHVLWRYAQALAETGRYDRAREVLAEIAALKSADSWQDYAKQHLEILKDLKAGDPLPPAIYDSLLRICPYWYGRRITSILDVWRRPIDAGQKAKLLVRLFEFAQDSCGRHLAWLWLAEQPGVDRNSVANALLAASQVEKPDAALARWQCLERDFAGTPAWSEAVAYIADALARQGRYRDAIAQYRKLDTPPAAGAAPGSLAWRTHRSNVATAIVQIAHCHFALGEYQKALECYQASEGAAAPVSFCGTCVMQHRCEVAFRQGLCREWMGDTVAGVRDYWRAAFAMDSMGAAEPVVLMRLTDIYEAAGKLDVWARLLDDFDRRFFLQAERFVRREGRPFDAGKFKEYLPTQLARKILEIRQLGLRKQWPELVAMLKPSGSYGRPSDPDVRRVNWQAVEAARLLARDPAAAVPLLKAALPGDPNAKAWIYYALGLCGTREAVEILLAQVPNAYHEQAVIAALSEAGELGRKAIADLDARGIARQYIEQFRNHDPPFGPCDLRFPPAAKDAKVPERLAALDDQVAYEESLPKSVALDQSTPVATVRTMFAAASIDDRETMLKCTDGSDHWKGIAEDLAPQSGRRMTYEVGEPKISGDTAEVPFKITDGKHAESGSFILTRKDGRWFASGIKESRP